MYHSIVVFPVNLQLIDIQYVYTVQGWADLGAFSDLPFLSNLVNVCTDNKNTFHKKYQFNIKIIGLISKLEANFFYATYKFLMLV